MSKTIHSQEDSFLKNGQILPFGAYDNIIGDTSLKHWDRQGGLVKIRRSQRKAWIFIGAYTEELMVGIAVVDAGYIGNAFAYIYIPSEDLYQEQKVLIPYGFPNNFDAGLYDEWSIRNFNIQTQGDILRASVNGSFQLNIELEHNDNGLSFICPTVDRPFNFTYKNLNLSTKVKVYYKGQNYEMDGKIGGIDFSKGYPPRHTFWNWALICGKTSSGIPVGMNLFKGHNGKYENAAWIGDERILLSDTTFTYNKSIPLDKQNWRLETEDGLVKLNFTPSNSRKEKINVKFLKHDFTQPFGKFEGTIEHEGKIHDVVGYGPVEEHESLW